MLTREKSISNSYNYELQHKKGKLHAYERLMELLDEGSFHEIGGGITNQVIPGYIKENTIPYDGVITGYGTIAGKLVYIYSQDFSVFGGTVGLNHAIKIEYLYKKAIESLCPIIGLNDSGGARIQEGVDSLSGYGRIFFQNVKASGLIPQISIILGSCAGGAAYSPALTDFVFVVDKISYMFLTGPTVLKNVTGEEISADELGGGNVHAINSGVAHFRATDEKSCFQQVKRLIDFLPGSAYQDDLPSIKYNYLPRLQTKIGNIIPESSRRVYDVHKIISEIVDSKSFVEVHTDFAKNIVVGFGKLMGTTIGVIANQPMELAGALTCDASDKASRFVRFCDSFNIPLVTLVDVPGFLPGKEEERKGAIRHGAKLLYAYSEAVVPKFTVILRKAYGGAYLAMCSKSLGADFTFAWKKAEMAVMGSEGATSILYKKDIARLNGEECLLFVKEASERYRSEVADVNNVARGGHIDEVISPEETRERLYTSLYLLRNKNLERKPTKKHGNIPL